MVMVQVIVTLIDDVFAIEENTVLANMVDELNSPASKNVNPLPCPLEMNV